MNTFSVKFNTVQGVARDLKDYVTSMNEYKGSIESVKSSLGSHMGARYYASFKNRLVNIETEMDELNKISSQMEKALEQIIEVYIQTEKKLAPSVGGGTKTPYGRIPEGFDEKIKDVIKALWEVIRKFLSQGGSEGIDWRKKILISLLTLGLLSGGKLSLDPKGTGGGGFRNSKEEEDSIPERLSNMLDLPGDISDAISTIYDVFDKDGYDESGVIGCITGVLGILSSGADMADSKTTSELYRNGVDLGKDIIGGAKDVLSLLKHADLVPDNNITGGLLFGLKEIKNAGAFSVDFLENYEKNKDSLARFFRDSGDMVEDISKFVQGAVTTNEGFLAGLKGKALVTAQMWGTTVTSLYTTGSYAIGDMIDKYQNGTLDWGSGAESWGKGAVGGIGKIHKFLTLGLVDPDMNKTWDIYMKHVDRNVELINKYGNNWFTRSGLTVYGTLDSFVEGSAEAIWSSSYDAAGKIYNGFQTAAEGAKNVGEWVWTKGSDIVSFFRR
jgi:uncharacterized protein YukE